jgi:hypothetical protein
MKVRLKIQLLDKMESKGVFSSQPNYVDLVNLIRSIQRAEGNLDCYRRGRQGCDRMDCAWRDHCLKTPEEPYKVGVESQAPKITANSRQDQDR